MPRKLQIDRNDVARLVRLQSWKEGVLNPQNLAIVKRVIDGKEITPNLAGIRRTPGEIGAPWLSMKERRLEGGALQKQMRDAGKIIDPELRNISLAKAADYIGTYYGINGPLRLEYEMQEPFGIFDTEVYVKQAISRKLALMFRNGFEILSDQQPDADYLEKRISTMEYVTGRTFESLMKGILFNLLLCSNCFVLKLRKEEAAPVRKKNEQKAPVAGYAIIPPHTIQPYLENGVITKWRRYFETGRPYQEIEIDDLIHFAWDKKPGHIGGTPRTIGVRDDIFALRRLEENVELLFINHLFPLFHVKVGTEEAPASYGEDGSSEIDLIKFQIENMPKEGVFVTDERTEVNAVGAEGKSLDYKVFVDHYKARIFTGLGVSAIDMGEGADATRATADNISQNLKDAIKADLDEFAGQIKMYMFKEWFMEANYSLSIQKALARTILKFHEIDMDNKIKEENHILNLFNNHLITEDEARKRMGQKLITEKTRRNLHFDLHVVRLVKETEKAKAAAAMEVAEQGLEHQKQLLPIQAKHQERVNHSASRHAMTQAKAAQMKAGAQTQVLQAKIEHHKATGGGRPQSATSKKTTQNKKLAQNKVTPTNQHGSNPSPTKAKSSRQLFLSELNDSLIMARSEMISGGLTSGEAWKRISAEVMDEVLSKAEEREGDAREESSYTRQIREGLARMKNMIAQTSDPELLSVLLSNGFDTEDGDEVLFVRHELAGYNRESAGDSDSAGGGNPELGGAL